MAKYLQLLGHQKEGISALLGSPECALLALPGSGKTSIALSILKITKTNALVVAPLATAINSWPGEIEKWVQFSGTDFAIAHGKNFEKAFDHQITIINPEGIKKLFANQHLLKNKDTLIVDESTFFKAWSSKRTKMIRKLAPLFKRRHIMTGTPVPKTLLAWFSQQYIVDLGKSFGTKITHFQAKYFHKGGFKDYDWIPNENTSEKMAELAKGRFHLAENLSYKTPGIHFVDVKVSLPESARKLYDEMKKKLTAEVGEHEVTAIDLRQKYMKLRQISAGGLYAADEELEDRVFEPIHKAKIEKLAEIVDEYAAPVIVGYLYDFELAQLKDTFKSKKCAEINGKVSTKQKEKAQKDWNAGKLDLLFVHPKSGGHGLNLQYGGRCIVYLTLPDDPELYGQFNARIDRLDSKSIGYIYRILVSGTVETAVVLPRLLERGRVQDLLLEHCKQTQASFEY